MDLYDRHISRKADELSTNTLRMAERLGETLQTDSLPLSWLEVCVTARTTQGHKITYTHDSIWGTEYPLSKDTRTSLRFRSPDEKRADQERARDSEILSKVSEQEHQRPEMANPLSPGTHLAKMAETGKSYYVQWDGHKLVILHQLPF